MNAALLVGGSGAIGGAIWSALEADGWKVIPTYCSKVGQGIHLDLTQPDFTSWAAGYLAQHPAPRAIVYAAGVNSPGPLQTRSAATFDHLMTVNARGPLLLTKALWESLEPCASITFIGSCSAQVGGPITPDYAMSKAALTALVKNLAILGAPLKIRVNQVSPGWIAGPWVSQAPVHVPLQRLGTPQDVAGAVRYLASDAASYVTGQTLSVNGGAYFHA